VDGDVERGAPEPAVGVGVPVGQRSVAVHGEPVVDVEGRVEHALARAVAVAAVDPQEHTLGAHRDVLGRLDLEDERTLLIFGALRHVSTSGDVS
jgi:hypothetical protein